MTGSTQRVLRLLELLQSADVRSVAELAERLDVDERTVRRYAAQLTEFGVPVESVRGRYGGYRLAAGFRTHPLMLSDEEAAAVVLGLVRSAGEPGVETATVRTALAKLRRALPEHVAARVDALEHALTPTGREPSAGAAARAILAAAEAIRTRHPLEIRYVDAEDVPSRRVIHPAELAQHAGRWYIRGIDAGKNEERVFRADRVRSARLLPGTFDLPNDSRDDADLGLRFATADYPWRVVLRVHAVSELIRTRLPESVATVEPLAEVGHHSAWQRVTIRAKSLEWLPAVILDLGSEVVIEEPEELRSLVRAAARRLAGIAEDTRPNHDDEL